MHKSDSSRDTTPESSLDTPVKRKSSRSRGRPKLSKTSLLVFIHELAAGLGKVVFVRADSDMNPEIRFAWSGSKKLDAGDDFKQTHKLAEGQEEIARAMAVESRALKCDKKTQSSKSIRAILRMA